MWTTLSTYVAHFWNATGTIIDTRSLVVWMVLLAVAGIALLRYDPRG
jgi:hypothetical protein